MMIAWGLKNHFPRLIDTPVKTGWHTLLPGLELRYAFPTSSPLSQVVMTRIDPRRHTFRLHYHPGQHHRLKDWQKLLPDAAMFVNANFFDKLGQAVGMLVADGKRYGELITERGGLFGITDGKAYIRYNRELVGEQGEMYEQAVQAFPMLIHDRSPIYTNREGDRITRRTAVAIDRCGRVILMATPLVGLHLADLASFLARDEFQITEAFNLDGGTSTMLSVPSGRIVLPSLKGVPGVLAVYSSVK